MLGDPKVLWSMVRNWCEHGTVLPQPKTRAELAGLPAHHHEVDYAQAWLQSGSGDRGYSEVVSWAGAYTRSLHSST
jgi:hypothetical protein